MREPPPDLERTLLGRHGKREGSEIRFRCPFPERHSNGDAKPSARYHPGKKVWRCDACSEGGGWMDLCRALHIELQPATSRIAATYPYVDEKGDLLFEVVRREPKDFRQRRPDGSGHWVWNLKGVRRAPYRLPQVIAAVGAEQPIYLVEGEKDADNLARLNLVATTAPGGAGKWRREYSPHFKGARVVILPDNDEAGRRHAQAVAASLSGIAAEVRILELPELPRGGDVSDWIELQRTESRSSEEIRELLVSKIEAAPAWEPAGDGKKPTIRVGPNEMVVVDRAVAALASRCEIFHRGGCLVHVVREEVQARGIVRPPSAPTIQPVAPARIREVLSDAATWLSEKGRQIHPPQWAVQALAARGKWPGLRPLEGIVEAPVVRPDGSILQEPGYDAETGLVFLPNGRFLPLQAAPSQSEAGHAAATILEVVADFPFATTAHRSAWLSSVLTVLSRFAFTGPSPLHLFDANVRGAGKSLLADVTAMIALGRSAARMAPSESEAEERKRITALALAGDPLILIDNVSGMLGSAPLDAALTGSTWVDRLLGQNLTVSLPLVATWMATGNNVVLRGDTSRRSLHIRLDSPLEFPEQRDGFRHPRLLAWVAEKRPELVAAASSILSGYFRAGSPDQGLSPWGSFEGWSSLIRNAIVWAGQPDPGDTRQALQTDSDRDHELLERLLVGWAEAVAKVGRPLSASEVITRLQVGDEEELSILRSAVIELCSSAGQLPSPRVLGNRLKKFRGRVIQGQALHATGKSKHGKTWAVQNLVNTGSIGDSIDSGDSSEYQGNLFFSLECKSSKSDGYGEESPESAESPDRAGWET